jgi:hypothetical protein
MFPLEKLRCLSRCNISMHFMRDGKNKRGIYKLFTTNPQGTVLPLGVYPAAFRQHL